jgi:DNA primase
MVTIKDRIALLLAIKEKGKSVTFEHLYEKVSRDVKFLEGKELSKEDVYKKLEEMVKEELAEKVENKFRAKEKVEEVVKNVFEKEKDSLNRSYLLVWIAKHYYQKAGKLMLPFLKDRAVSAIKVFSGKRDPIHDINPIFIRYVKYKPKPIHLTINSIERLMELVFDHCIDFIPYVHKLNANEPDLFVLDLDAGSNILKHLKAFDYIKFVTYELADMLEEHDISNMIKFSGSRGFQIWVKFDNSKINGDKFKAYREIAQRIQAKLEERLSEKRGEIRKEFKGIIKEGEPLTTSTVAHKERRANQILIDWSSMKPMGDVRAPLSIHYKTGLVSLPLTKNSLIDFKPDDAEAFNVLEKLDKVNDVVKLKVSSPEPFI